MENDEPICTACGTPLVGHLGLIETCARRIEGAAYIRQITEELRDARERLRLAEAHRKMIDASMRELADLNQTLRDRLRKVVEG